MDIWTRYLSGITECHISFNWMVCIISIVLTLWSCPSILHLSKQMMYNFSNNKLQICMKIIANFVVPKHTAYKLNYWWIWRYCMHKASFKTVRWSDTPEHNLCKVFKLITICQHYMLSIMEYLIILVSFNYLGISKGSHGLNKSEPKATLHISLYMLSHRSFVFGAELLYCWNHPFTVNYSQDPCIVDSAASQILYPTK